LPPYPRVTDHHSTGVGAGIHTRSCQMPKLSGMRIATTSPRTVATPFTHTVDPTITLRPLISCTRPRADSDIFQDYRTCTLSFGLVLMGSMQPDCVGIAAHAVRGNTQPSPHEERSPPSSRLGIVFQDQRRSTLGDHHHGKIRIAAGNAWHDRGVDDT
jgi:hypothetical protein